MVFGAKEWCRSLPWGAYNLDRHKRKQNGYGGMEAVINLGKMYDTVVLVEVKPDTRANACFLPLIFS